MNNDVIIALDFPSELEVNKFLEKFAKEQLFLKIGMELFYQEGPQIVRNLKEKGHQIFLDLKLHDIPNTVYRAAKGLASLGVDILTVHAAGGKEMMKAAIQGLQEGSMASSNRPLCIAVTQLTSTSETQMRQEQLISATLEETVIHYAKLANEAGLDGAVCSVHEAPIIREELGKSFYIITPGIRMKGDPAGDQKRSASPSEAKKKGSNGIVVGRSITNSNNPLKSYKEIKAEWELKKQWEQK